MRMHVVTENGRSFRLLLPTRLLLNGVTASIAAKAAKEKGLPIPRTAILNFFHCILDYRKQHPDWILVDVESSGGETIYIKF